jgi:NitT/TauT family transport system substrate-binding protein
MEKLGRRKDQISQGLPAMSWRKKMRSLSKIIIAGLAALSFAAGFEATAVAADKATMRLNFTPWAMHVQYFAGVAQGFYAQEGIDLEIRPPSGGQQNEVFIGTGREQFGVANADSFIKARASGLGVVAVMADEPDTPFSVITLKKDNYTDPKELKGKKLSWFQSNVKGLLDPMLISAGLTRNDIEYVNVARGAEVQMLAAGQVNAVFGYSFGQALTLDERGFPTKVFALKDYGVKFYGTVVYTSEQLLRSNPDLVKRYVRATLKALAWTRDNMEKAVAEMVKVSPDRDVKLETKKLAIIYELYNSPDYAERFGLMNDAKWQSSIDILADSGDLPKKPTASEMYTNAILESLDEAKALAQAIKAPRQ